MPEPEKENPEPMLPRITSPDDLKKVPVEDLPRLAAEIRGRIMDVVDRRGGHLASNLGAVEMSIALNYVYDFTNGGIFFDVGHQCYTHKILTGRNSEFDSLRSLGGVSGFPNPGESDCDAFAVGHAGTAISTAWGSVLADDLKGDKRHVVAVIGDAAIASGMPFEAMFHIGALKKNILVVLNDNEMSISQTVGSLHRYLHRVRLSPLFTEIKKDLFYIIDHIPIVGRRLERSLGYLKNAVLHFVVPGQLFADLGFSYYGPVDGHDIDLLIKTFEEIKNIEGPVFLHVLTEKGKGYQPAEETPEEYHGVGPHAIKNGENGGVGDTKPVLETGERAAAADTDADKGAEELEPGHVAPDKVKTQRIPQPVLSYTDVFSEKLVDLGREREDVVAITAAMPDGTGTSRFAKAYPDRFFDVGICEPHAVALAGGLASRGILPVVAVYSTFIQRALDQVNQEIALQGHKVIFCLDRGGLVGSDGPTHHGVYDIAMFRIMPGAVLMSPSSGSEFAAMLDFAAGPVDKLVFIRYPRGTIPEGAVLTEVPPIVLGKGRIVEHGSADSASAPGAAILSYGHMLANALEARRVLAKAGIALTIADARFAKPVDSELIASLCETHELVITLEDHVLAGGFGSAVLEAAVAQCPDHAAKIVRLGIPDEFIEHGSQPELHAQLKIDGKGIAVLIEARIS